MNSASIEQALSAGATAIAQHSDQGMLESQILLAHLLQKNRAYLYSWPEKLLSDGQLTSFLSMIERRQAGEPIAYITGVKEFWSLSLKVTPDVLIPRPETELLVQLALDLLPQSACKVSDLGTGSGAIALALASERPAWNITAIDNSSSALHIAQENAEALELDPQINFVLGSWCEPITEPQHAIISNPPYIENNDPHLRQDGLEFEPQSALHSGKDGLDDIRKIAETAAAQLHTEGLLLLEHGYDQQLSVIEILKSFGYQNIQGYADEQQQDRVTVAKAS